MKHLVEAETLFENGIRVYKHYYCQRCGKRIKVCKTHRRTGIPEYHSGHHPNSGYKKGNKLALGHRHTLEFRRKMSVRMSGIGNPNYGKDMSGANNPNFGKHRKKVRS